MSEKRVKGHSRGDTNVRQRLSSAISSGIVSCLARVSNNWTDQYLRWWMIQSTLHPNWCGHLELPSTYYDRVFACESRYQVHYSQSHYYPIWDRIAKRLSALEIRRVLDIGCGTGQLAALLLDKSVLEYTGLDFSSTAVEMAKRHAPRGLFQVGDARLSNIYETAEYEAIVCTEVLEHIRDDLVVVSRFPKGKRCLCTVPNYPCESHVRSFQNQDEVKRRYAAFFANLDVDAVRLSPKGESVYFLFDGVRNEYSEGQTGTI